MRRNFYTSGQNRKIIRQWVLAAFVFVFAVCAAVALPMIPVTAERPPETSVFLHDATTASITITNATTTRPRPTFTQPATTAELPVTAPPPTTAPRDPEWPPLPELPGLADNINVMNPTPDFERVIDPNKPMVALTFDDGPVGASTKPILETLHNHHALATFFMLGDNVERYPETARLVAQSGHDIGVHAWRHEQFTKLSPKEIQDNVLRTYEMICAKTGVAPRWIRTPYGERNQTILQNLALPLILWNVDTEDWRYSSVSDFPRRVLSANIKDGDIILMHDIMPVTVSALDALMCELEEMGFQFVTISEMFFYADMAATPGHYYTSLPRNKPAR